MPDLALDDGRVNPEGRQYQIQNLWEMHHEILRRLVIGQKAVDIARDLGITPVMVSYVRNSEIGKRQLRLMNSAANQTAIDVKQRIKRLAADAIRVMEDALNPDSPLSLRFQAAKDVLDRAGFGAPKIIRSENLHAHLTTDDIAEIKERARLMSEKSGIFIEAELCDNEPANEVS